MGKYIDGIFNYCDGWCERCPFTGRCRNFSLREAVERRARRRDAENAAFWEAMTKACGDALADVTRQAESLDPPAPEPMDAEQGNAACGREPDDRDADVDDHPLARLSDEYLWAAHRWLERRRGHVPAEAADAVEVIAWYHMFIHVKFTRALSGQMDRADEDDEDDAPVAEQGNPFPSDADGSAKVAIIAIERSFAAWSLVRDRVNAERKTAAKMMAVLLRMRALAERQFPNARTFHRPGFDDVGSRD